jgi:hypothetical protein
MNRYNQESKNMVRETMLGRAIVALTTERHSAELIARDELQATFDHFLDLIEVGFKTDELRPAAEAELQEWMDFDGTSNGPRHPGELKVLYLCGPAPLNDLVVLLDHGINIHNVWAVTGSSEDSREAHRQLAEFNLALKVHEGSLGEFFEMYNEVFDLIYFDACGPFMGGKPNTLTPLQQILERQRLAPKGALITTYSGPPESGVSRERYVDLATAYFHARYNDLPEIVRCSDLDPECFAVEPEMLRQFTVENLDAIYSDLVTNLTIDLAAVIVPNLRAFSMPAFFKKHTSGKDSVDSVLARQTSKGIDDYRLIGDILLNPRSYPILSFVNLLERTNKQDPLLNALRGHNRKNVFFKHIISVSELTNAVVEGNWHLLSTELGTAMECSWFDERFRITCDLPLPNLLVSSIVGTYGRPYLYNAKQSCRVQYVSNVQEMFCDLFVFEQCRSFFDWFPTVQACPSRFKSTSFQIVARCLIDRLGWANFYNTANPFRGSAIAGRGETWAAKPLSYPDRTVIQ